jgi:trehalose-phosphatase
VQHLFECWENFASAVRTAPHILLLSDYDGTLTPIVGRPEEAVLPSRVKKTLLALAAHPDFTVGIVSGRLLSDAKALVGLKGIYYACNHGLEIEGPGLKLVNPIAESTQSEMEDIARQLSEKLAGIEGIIIEDKGLTLSVHYRMVSPNDEAKAAKLFRQVITPLLDTGRIRITSGKKVWEVRPPVDWHKGMAVQSISQMLSKAGVTGKGSLTIYLGDDITDEDAFKILHPPQGWGILIGQENQASAADYFLKSTDEVEVFLSRLLELKSG